MDAAQRSQLIEGLGGVSEREGTLVPESVDALATLCARLTAEATPFSVVSGDAEAGGDRGVVISLRRLARVDVDAPAGVLHAGAGVPMAEVQDAAAAAGCTVLSGHGSVAHLGSAIARGTLPRRALLSVTLVLPDGRVIGGDVLALKNVAGYDWAGAALGSRGGLAIIAGASLRLVPVQAAAAVFEAAGECAAPFPALLATMNPAGLLRPAR